MRWWIALQLLLSYANVWNKLAWRVKIQGVGTFYFIFCQLRTCVSMRVSYWAEVEVFMVCPSLTSCWASSVKQSRKEWIERAFAQKEWQRISLMVQGMNSSSISLGLFLCSRHMKEFLTEQSFRKPISSQMLPFLVSLWTSKTPAGFQPFPSLMASAGRLPPS